MKMELRMWKRNGKKKGPRICLQQLPANKIPLHHRNQHQHISIMISHKNNHNNHNKNEENTKKKKQNSPKSSPT